jgi:hypothetical protein
MVRRAVKEIGRDSQDEQQQRIAQQEGRGKRTTKSVYQVVLLDDDGNEQEVCAELTRFPDAMKIAKGLSELAKEGIISEPWTKAMVRRSMVARAQRLQSGNEWTF